MKRYEELSKESRDYINRFATSNNITIEEAMKHAIVIEVVNNYEK